MPRPALQHCPLGTSSFNPRRSSVMESQTKWNEGVRFWGLQMTLIGTSIFQMYNIHFKYVSIQCGGATVWDVHVSSQGGTTFREPSSHLSSWGPVHWFVSGCGLKGVLLRCATVLEAMFGSDGERTVDFLPHGVASWACFFGIRPQQHFGIVLLGLWIFCTLNLSIDGSI